MSSFSIKSSVRIQGSYSYSNIEINAAFNRGILKFSLTFGNRKINLILANAAHASQIRNLTSTQLGVELYQAVLSLSLFHDSLMNGYCMNKINHNYCKFSLIILEFT